MTNQKSIDKGKGIKRFIVTEFDLVRNRQPLVSFAVAHLFYGVPFNFNTVYREPTTHNLIFTF